MKETCPKPSRRDVLTIGLAVLALLVPTEREQAAIVAQRAPLPTITGEAPAVSGAILESEECQKK